MLGLKEPCLKSIFKTGLLIYTLFYFSLRILFSNWHIGVGHVIAPGLFFFQFYFLLYFLQRRGVRCGEVQCSGMNCSIPAFAYAGLLTASMGFSRNGDALDVLGYIVTSTVTLILAMYLARGSKPVPTAESKT